MECIICYTINDDDANYCKKCGQILRTLQPTMVFSLFSQQKGRVKDPLEFNLVGGPFVNGLEVVELANSIYSPELTLWIGGYREEDANPAAIQCSKWHELQWNGERHTWVPSIGPITITLTANE